MDNNVDKLIWTATEIVNLVDVLAWPLASVALVFLLRSKLSGFLNGFFNRNNVTELSAGSFTAKFTQSKQGANNLEDKQEKVATMPHAGEDATEFLTRLSQNETKTSKNILKGIQSHISSLGLSGNKAIEVLEIELSLTQARIYFLDLNRVLYRSQYNLLTLLKDNSGKLAESEVSIFYEKVKSNFPLVFGSTELINYLAYPMRVNLIEKNGSCYCLTDYGDSYLSFMDKNSHLIMELNQN